MGKKNKNSSLGKALIKDRFSSKKGHREHDNLLHTADLNDGYDWARLNLQSVTEQSSFEEFLSTAELAGTEFQAEKLNVTFVQPSRPVGVLTAEERKQFEKSKEQKKELLKIPRRPKWTPSTTAEELKEAERQSFLEWRRGLAELQEVEGLTLTPYEKNLDFWRQLWRVVERSDFIVQIVDARNPLLYRCEDLEKYVKEVSPQKSNMLLVNKADFLTVEQRRAWARYFDKEGIRVAFFSAVKAAQEIIEEEEEEGLEVKGARAPPSEVQQVSDSDPSDTENEVPSGELDEESDDGLDKGCGVAIEKIPNGELNSECSGGNTAAAVNSAELLNRQELIELFEQLEPPAGEEEVAGGGVRTTIGLVGYPNVGKSSTINALIGNKKVSVSATPGKTKHFQTLFLTDRVVLCDCPGLVMPTLVASKADMVVGGILPIDQMRDYIGPSALIAALIGRRDLESHYGIMINPPREGEDPDRPPTAQEFLDPYAYSRGFMTQNGQPDMARAARWILKDVVEGRLLYCWAPPGVDQSEYHILPTRGRKHAPAPTPQTIRALQSERVSTNDLDKAFFKKASLGAHSKGVSKILPGKGTTPSGLYACGPAKPWKDHSEKRNKREKLRRVYSHLDH